MFNIDYIYHVYMCIIKDSMVSPVNNFGFGNKMSGKSSS